MKFAVTFLLLALALGANASIIPGLLGTHLGSHVVLGHHAPAAITVAASPVHHHHALLGHTVLGTHAIAGPGPVQIVSGPAAIAAPAVVAAHDHAHAHVVTHDHAHVHAHAHLPGAVHVAKTRGAVHVAPLAGHLQSVVSANLQPAPGTH